MMLTSLLKAQTDLRQMSVDYIKQTKNVSFTSAQWLITDQIYDKNTQTTFLYLRQMHAGKEIFNVNVNFSIKNNKVLHMAGTPKKDYSVRSAASGMSAESAIRAAATGLNLKITEPLTSSNSANAKGINVTKFSKAGISQEPIPVKEMYYLNAKNELVSVWNLSIYENSGDNWWDLLVDAQSGQIVNKANWVTHCNFGLHEKNNQNNDNCEDKHVHTPSTLVEKITACPEDRVFAKNIAKKPTLNVIPSTIPRVGGNQYNIFPLPIEAPSYGARSIVQDPESLPASPFGWHDTNGVIGAEFTITRGNNVYAYRDADATANVPDPGSSPDGGATLNFDFPFPTTQEPDTYVPASVTNLFYWNNKVHDFYYRYGFDDVSGNFQTNNYGRGGLGNDAVNAETQDGSGTNNANFSTPPDGSSPRMQMYIWNDGSPTNLLTVNSPAAIAGGYLSTPSTTFGLQITATTNITGNIQLMNDGSADPTLGCVASPAGSLTGKIALIDRGSPAASPGLGTFVLKAKNAQNAGAIGVIIVNNVAGAPAGMSGTDPTITIPIVMVSQADGLILKNSLAVPNVVSATFRSVTPVGATPKRDSSFDSGIVAHEYGHGISTRLTGGPANSGCLQNAEQMGEGWSDFFGLMMTMLPSHTGATPRGIGTYATYQPTTGGGIRPAPYTTNMAINPYTYSGVANPAISQPHGIGFIWCTMLWEVNWGMIGRYGFDNDLQNGNGGNNKTIQLVLLALKLQPCGPGFVDGRDALLAADTQLFGGANHDIIWIAFSKRGLGLNASQGDPNVRGDGVEDTTVPPQFNPGGCAAGNSKIVLPSGFASPAEFCLGNVATIGTFGKIFTISTPPVALYDYGYLLAKNGNLFQFNTTGLFNFATLGEGFYTVIGISYKNTNLQTMTAYLTARTGSPISTIQAEIGANTICASLGKNNSTYNLETEITIRSVAYCTNFCSPVSGKIKLPTNFPVASVKLCEGEILAIGAFDKVQTVFLFPAVASDYDYNYLLTKNGNIFQFSATGIFDFTSLTEGVYTIAGISYKKANPQTISSYLSSRIGTTIDATKAAITAQNTCAEITTQSTLNAGINITILSKSVCAITATDPQFRQSVKVFPNPTSQNINVEFTNLPNETLQIVMYNMQGMEVLAQKVNTTTNVSLENISLKTLPKGVYVMKIQMKDKFVMEKIIVN